MKEQIDAFTSELAKAKERASSLQKALAASQLNNQALTTQLIHEKQQHERLRLAVRVHVDRRHDQFGELAAVLNS